MSQSGSANLMYGGERTNFGASIKNQSIPKTKATVNKHPARANDAIVSSSKDIPSFSQMDSFVGLLASISRPLCANAWIKATIAHAAGIIHKDRSGFIIPLYTPMHIAPLEETAGIIHCHFISFNRPYTNST